MRFLVDQNLPVSLVGFLEAAGHAANHVKRLGMVTADDEVIWSRAVATDACVVTKDEDFARLARTALAGNLLWLRVGNISNRELFKLLGERLTDAVRRLDDGQRIVEIAP